MGWDELRLWTQVNATELDNEAWSWQRRNILMEFPDGWTMEAPQQDARATDQRLR
jgi:hypothetical protein